MQTKNSYKLGIGDFMPIRGNTRLLLALVSYSNMPMHTAFTYITELRMERIGNYMAIKKANYI